MDELYKSSRLFSAKSLKSATEAVQKLADDWPKLEDLPNLPRFDFPKLEFTLSEETRNLLEKVMSDSGMDNAGWRGPKWDLSTAHDPVEYDTLSGIVDMGDNLAESLKKAMGGRVFKSKPEVESDVKKLIQTMVERSLLEITGSDTLKIFFSPTESPDERMYHSGSGTISFPKIDSIIQVVGLVGALRPDVDSANVNVTFRTRKGFDERWTIIRRVKIEGGLRYPFQFQSLIDPEKYDRWLEEVAATFCSTAISSFLEANPILEGAGRHHWDDHQSLG